MKINLPVTQIEHDYPDSERLISETNLKGIITAANASFCTVAGFSHEELMGKNHNIVRHPDMPPEAFADLWRTVKAGERWVGVVKNRCKNGNHYWVKAFVSPVVQNGQLVRYRSVRQKPAREEIVAAEQLYQRMRAGEKNLVDTLGALQRRAGMAGRCKVWHMLALAVGLPILWTGGLAAAALAGAGPVGLAALLLAAALSSVLVGRLAYGWLKQPLQELSRMAAALERGELGARADIYGRSELAQAARELNRALDGVELVLSEVAQLLSGIARGEFGRRIMVTLPGELDRTREAANRMADQIEAMVAGLTRRLADLAEGRFRGSGNEGRVHVEGKFREAQEHAETAKRQLSELLAALMTVTQAMAEGDLTRVVGVQGAGELGTLCAQMHAAQAALRRVLADVHVRSESVAQAAQEITAASAGIATGAQSQTQVVEEVRESVHGVMAVMAKVVADAGEASVRSRETMSAVQAGQGKMNQMAEVVQAIQQQSNKIAGITEIIEDIAGQTNLLALNAAIEAARAGESGKGFAVVAEEVRKLAGRAAESTQAIRSLVDEAIAGAQQADMSVSEVAGGMEGLRTSVCATDDLLGQVAEVLQQQSTALLQAGKQVESLSEIAQSNAAVTEELSASAEELQRIAGAMCAEVGRFRLGDGR